MKKLLFFVSEDWYFCSHRLALGKAAVDEGYDVYVMCNVTKHQSVIEQNGIKVVKLDINRSDTGIMSNVRLLKNVISILKSVRPDIVHNVAQKPVLMGTLAAKLCGTPKVINALGGLGFIFSSESLKARLLRPFFLVAYKFLLNTKSSNLIVQNQDDFQYFKSRIGLSDQQLTMIRGAGIDTETYKYHPVPQGEKTRVVLVARMLKDKGILEFINAAKLLNQSNENAEFVLIGDTDPKNPNSFDDDELKALTNEAHVTWLGRRDDINEQWQSSHISVLPSYREGLPKSLLESASVGRAIVTTDVPGCREVVNEGINGYLVPKGDYQLLAERLRLLINSRQKCIEMGLKSREMVEKYFAIPFILQKTLELYRK